MSNQLLSPIKRLRCSCCGEDTFGRQWYNRDIGFGLCHSCADRIEQKENFEYMERCYGVKGVHYYVTVPYQEVSIEKSKGSP